MLIFMAGASGFIGTRLSEQLGAAGHEVVALRRRAPHPGERAVMWRPGQEQLDPQSLAGADAVINLAGENLAGGRWNDRRKQAILDSRVLSTRTLARAIARMARPPRVWINASAIGFYGPRGAERLDESYEPGNGFLAEVCRAWELATAPADEAGVRVVQTRFGVVLDPGGGALGLMLPFFRAGLGGRLGNGRQYMSWVTLDDVVGAIAHVLFEERLRGPVNVVAPGAVTNRAFTHTLGALVRRPTLLPAPAFALRLALGRELANQTLLASARVEPRRLLETGYEFRDPELRPALERLLRR